MAGRFPHVLVENKSCGKLCYAKIDTSNCGNSGPHAGSIITLCCCHISGCVDGDVRLVSGADSNEGRVEICFDDEWGTVCDEMWDDTDAAVVCSQLRLRYTGTVKLVLI